MDQIEIAQKKAEQRYEMTWETVKNVLKVHAPKAYDYVIDTEDSWDGWEDTIDGFFQVWFDFVAWIENQ